MTDTEILDSICSSNDRYAEFFSAGAGTSSDGLGNLADIGTSKVGQAWDSTYTYAAGDFVSYSGTIYVANAASTNSVPGVGAEWDTLVATPEGYVPVVMALANRTALTFANQLNVDSLTVTQEDYTNVPNYFRGTMFDFAIPDIVGIDTDSDLLVFIGMRYDYLYSTQAGSTERVHLVGVSKNLISVRVINYPETASYDDLVYFSLSIIAFKKIGGV